MRDEWQQEAQERYGLTGEQIKEVEQKLEEITAKPTKACGQRDKTYRLGRTLALCGSDGHRGRLRADPSGDQRACHISHGQVAKLNCHPIVQTFHVSPAGC
eukprot:scaffold652347_cov32-Prasinocladus_malaysianus.AAC.1